MRKWGLKKSVLSLRRRCKMFILGEYALTVKAVLFTKIVLRV